jgi:hypothetical protein
MLIARGLGEKRRNELTLIARFGWQDKGRKVWPAGRLRILSNSKHAPNVAGTQYNLRNLPKCCFPSAFETLRLSNSRQ